MSIHHILYLDKIRLFCDISFSIQVYFSFLQIFPF